MTKETRDIFKRSVAMEIQTDCCYGDVIDAMSRGDSMSFGFSVLLVDGDDIQTIERARGTVDLEVRQFFGFRSAYGRIGVFEAVVTDIYRIEYDGGRPKRQVFDLPLIQKDAIVTFLYDNLRQIGCICRAVSGSEQMELKKTDIFAKYSIDDKPVRVRRPKSTKLDDILLSLNSGTGQEEAVTDGSACGLDNQENTQILNEGGSIDDEQSESEAENGAEDQREETGGDNASGAGSGGRSSSEGW